MVNETIVPGSATQRIILKIVGFYVKRLGLQHSTRQAKLTADMGEGGVKKLETIANVLYGWSLSSFVVHT